MTSTIVSRRSRVGLWFEWLRITILGYLGGAIILSVALVVAQVLYGWRIQTPYTHIAHTIYNFYSSVGMTTFVIVSGLSIGIAQGWIVYKVLSKKWLWILSATLGPIAGFILLNLQIIGTHATALNGLTGGLISGAIIGWVQGWHFRQQPNLLRQWIIGTTFGYCLGLFSVGAFLDSRFGISLTTLKSDYAWQATLTTSIIWNYFVTHLMFNLIISLIASSIVGSITGITWSAIALNAVKKDL